MIKDRELLFDRETPPVLGGRPLITVDGKAIPRPNEITGTPKSVWDKINNPFRDVVAIPNDGDKISTPPTVKSQNIKQDAVIIDQTDIDEKPIFGKPIQEIKKVISSTDQKLSSINEHLSVENILIYGGGALILYLLYKSWK